MRVSLSPHHAINIDDRERTIADRDWAEVAAYIVDRLKEFRPRLEVRPVWANETLGSRQEVAAATSRARRFALNCETETKDAVEWLVLELLTQSVDAVGPLVLQLRGSDAIDNHSNLWGEFYFIHGRLLQGLQPLNA